MRVRFLLPLIRYRKLNKFNSRFNFRKNFKKPSYRKLLSLKFTNSKHPSSFYFYTQSDEVFGWFSSNNFFSSFFTYTFTNSILISMFTSFLFNTNTLFTFFFNLLCFFILKKNYTRQLLLNVVLLVVNHSHLTSNFFLIPQLLTRQLLTSYTIFLRSSYNYNLSKVTLPSLKPRTSTSSFKITLPAQIKYTNTLFNQMRIKWDFAMAFKLSWPYVHKLGRISLSSYYFRYSTLKSWASIKILTTTPQWKITHSSNMSLNSYVFTAAFTPYSTTFLTTHKGYFETSFEERRQQVVLNKVRKNKYRRKSKNLSTYFESFFGLPFQTKFKNTYISNLNFSSSFSKTLPTLLLKSFSQSTNISLLFIDVQAFKWVLYSVNLKHSLKQILNFHFSILNTELATSFFYTRSYKIFSTNLVALPLFAFKVEKHFIKVINKIKYNTTTTHWQIMHMHRFFTFCTGKKVMIKINPFIRNALTLEEQALCLKWSSKVRKFRKSLGTSLFLNESLQIFYLAFKLKDPYLFANWLTKMLQKVNFWKSRLMLSYVRYVIRNFFFARFQELGFRGLKLQLSGKISVAGNARTRTLRYKVGYTGQSTFDNKILTVFNRIPSFTGVQGLKIWFFF